MNQTVREALFMLVLFFANTVQAITGFAGTVLAMPFSILLIGAADAKVVLNIMALVSCLWIALRSRANVNMRELARMTGFMAVGMAAGCVLYAACPADPLQKAYGAVIVAIAVKNLIHPATGERTRPWVCTAINLFRSALLDRLAQCGGFDWSS